MARAGFLTGLAALLVPWLAAAPAGAQAADPARIIAPGPGCLAPVLAEAPPGLPPALAATPFQLALHACPLEGAPPPPGRRLRRT